MSPQNIITFCSNDLIDEFCHISFIIILTNLLLNAAFAYINIISINYLPRVYWS